MIAVIVAIGSAVIFVPWLTVWAYLKPLPDTVQEQVDDADLISLVGGPSAPSKWKADRCHWMAYSAVR